MICPDRSDKELLTVNSTREDYQQQFFEFRISRCVDEDASFGETGRCASADEIAEYVSDFEV